MDLTALPDKVKELVRAHLEAGRFQSVDEVVCEALRLLQEREDLFASHRDELRAVRRSPTYVAGSMSAYAPESDPSISACRSG